MGFSRQEYWSGLPLLSPEDLPDPRDQIWVSCIAGRFFSIWAIGKTLLCTLGLLKGLNRLLLRKHFENAMHTLRSGDWFHSLQASLWNQFLPSSGSALASFGYLPHPRPHPHTHTHTGSEEDEHPRGSSRPSSCSHICSLPPSGVSPTAARLSPVVVNITITKIIFWITSAWTPAQKLGFNWSGLSVIY